MTDKLKNIVKELIPYMIIVVTVVLFRTYIATPVMVDGNSMNPTLKDNNVMILNKLGKVNRYDIVVVKTNSGNTLIKRVMGLPGETIECIDGKIIVNGNIIEDKTERLTDDFEEVKIEDGTYFVMGDNRGNSLDSRDLGTVTKDEIKGTSSFVIWPFSNFGKVE